MRVRAYVAANRRNAKWSSGPRSDAGKAKAAKNAVKHGLSVPAAELPELAGDLADLAALLDGIEKKPGRNTRLAEAELDLLRIRRARLAAEEADDPVAALERLERYERRAWSRRQKALRALVDGAG